jgi:hypothetical protein
MSGDLFLRLPDRDSLRREITRARFAGTKNPATTHEGVKAGKQKLDFSPIRFLAKPLPASSDAGLDEREQAGLLTSRSSYFASLTIREDSDLLAFRSSLQRRYRAGFTPASLFSSNHGLRHSFTLNPQLIVGFFKELHKV